MSHLPMRLAHTKSGPGTAASVLMRGHDRCVYWLPRLVPAGSHQGWSQVFLVGLLNATRILECCQKGSDGFQIDIFFSFFKILLTG